MWLTAIRSIENNISMFVDKRAFTHYYDKLPKSQSSSRDRPQSLGGNLFGDRARDGRRQAGRMAGAAKCRGAPADQDGCETALTRGAGKTAKLFDLRLESRGSDQSGFRAHKWTSISARSGKRTKQARRRKIDEDYGHDFFPDHQRPVVVAVDGRRSHGPG